MSSTKDNPAGRPGERLSRMVQQLDPDQIDATKMSRSLKGRCAFVTGAASGMGRATAQALAEQGVRVAITDINEDGLKETAEFINTKIPGGFAKWRVLDVADEKAIQEAARWANTAVGPITILINNAGITGMSSIEDTEQFSYQMDRNYAINVKAQGLLVSAFLPELRASGGLGRVVNIASTEGIGGTLNNSPYTAMKHASVGLTKGLAIELGSQGITVNAICPGPIRTGMTSVIPDKAKDMFATRLVPLRRYGFPEEVAQVIVSVCLPSSSYLNGAIIPVDGGILVNNALLPRKLPWELDDK
eukprot:Clim_evm12s6 gene=Clim_evmTU12s6